MATKSEIEALIDSDLASGSNITASEHRNVLKNSEDSVLKNSYNDTVLEENTGLHPNTIPNANFAYSLNFCKQGRKVHATGAIIVTAASNQYINSIILELDPASTDHVSILNAYGIMTNSNNGEHIEVKMIGNELQLGQAVAPNERFKLSLTYYTQN